MTLQAISLLKNGYHLSLTNAGIQKGNTWKHVVSRSHHTLEIQKIAAYIQRKMGNGEAAQRAEFLPFADALIQRYKTDRSVAKILAPLDRQIASFRPRLVYLFPPNQKAFQKWKGAGQSEQIFRDFPQFTNVLESSLLLSQIKVTRDEIRIVEGEPAILVEGHWTKESDLYRRFQMRPTKIFGEKLIIDQQTRQVYTYLDNGLGLQEHHPYLSAMRSISTLNEGEYQRTWAKATAFIRPEEMELPPQERAQHNQNRPFILQFVTSKMKEGTSNLYQLFRNPKHPYLRLIVGRDNPELNIRKGEVYEIGYGSNQIPCFPLRTTTGSFRSPDLWEYKMCDEKVVTNIPLTQEEAARFYQFAIKYYRDGINLGMNPGFDVIQQNCSVFTREACKAAGISVPTAIPFTEILSRITPDIFLRFGRSVNRYKQLTSNAFYLLARCITPLVVLNGLIAIEAKILKLMAKVRDLGLAFLLTPLHAILGGTLGRGGPAFRQPHERPRNIEPQFFNWRYYFDLSQFKLNLPAVAQEWQLKQPSTVVYQNPVKLTIVPPPA